jgi:hypothetical protein
MSASVGSAKTQTGIKAEKIPIEVIVDAKISAYPRGNESKKISVSDLRPRPKSIIIILPRNAIKGMSQTSQ